MRRRLIDCDVQECKRPAWLMLSSCWILNQTKIIQQGVQDVLSIHIAMLLNETIQHLYLHQSACIKVANRFIQHNKTIG